jgi:hypothetical protein
MRFDFSQFTRILVFFQVFMFSGLSLCFLSCLWITRYVDWRVDAHFHSRKFSAERKFCKISLADTNSLSLKVENFQLHNFWYDIYHEWYFIMNDIFGKSFCPWKLFLNVNGIYSNLTKERYSDYWKVPKHCFLFFSWNLSLIYPGVRLCIKRLILLLMTYSLS